MNTRARPGVIADADAANAWINGTTDLSLWSLVVKKNRTGLIVGAIVGGLVLICGLCGGAALLANNASKDNASATTPLTGTATADTEPAAVAVPTKPGKPAGVGLNQPARDGKFEFTVTKVECGIAQIGDEYLNVKAQGQFCEVAVTVKNIGNEARMFDASSQHAYNAAGQKYDADSTAGIYLKDAGNAFLKDINPGNSVAGTLVFDIAKGASIKRFELHDSAFSGGVIVTP